MVGFIALSVGVSLPKSSVEAVTQAQPSMDNVQVSDRGKNYEKVSKLVKRVAKLEHGRKTIEPNGGGGGYCYISAETAASVFRSQASYFDETYSGVEYNGPSRRFKVPFTRNSAWQVYYSDQNNQFYSAFPGERFTPFPDSEGIARFTVVCYYQTGPYTRVGSPNCPSDSDDSPRQAFFAFGGDSVESWSNPYAGLMAYDGTAPIMLVVPKRSLAFSEDGYYPVMPGWMIRSDSVVLDCWW